MIKRLSSEKIPKAVGAYSSASLVGNLIFTSGQLPINPMTNSIDGETIEEQVTQAMQNIKNLLQDNQSSLDDIVKTTVYLKDITHFASFNKVYETFFNGDYPSRTAFEVGALPMNALVEIEVIASVKEV